MSLVTITSSKTNIANISTVLAELNIRVNDNQSTLLGYQAGTQVRGLFNTIIGYNAARESVQANAYTVTGFGAGELVNGNSNTLYGATTGMHTTTGVNNVFVGANSGTSNTVGSMNTYIGTASGAYCVGSSSANVCVGCWPNVPIGNVSAASNVVVGYASASTSTNGLVLGCDSINKVNDSILLGGGIRNSGANSCIISTEQGVENMSSGFLYIEGRLIGERKNGDASMYRLQYIGEDIELCVSRVTGGAMLTGNRDCATLYSRLLANDVSASSLTFFVPGGESNVSWVVQTGPAYGQSGPTPEKRAADLLFRSANSNAIIFTDEFAPELFNFTAKHRCDFAEDNNNKNDGSTEDPASLTGLIVICTGAYRNLDGSTEPTIDESLPVVEISRRPRDPRVFGVIAGFEDHGIYAGALDSRIFRLGHLRFAVPKHQQEQPHSKVVVNSLGEGGIWVCDANGHLSNGDLVCSSPLPGYGMKQNESYITSWTVAKVTCTCDFSFRTDRWKQSKIVDGHVCCFVGCSYKC
jgi:hypothetical protein